MGILYIDEAGNTGLKDNNQPNLIYGGPYVRPIHWSKAITDFKKIEHKYKALIYQRFNKPTSLPPSFEKLADDVEFFREFYFHATEIINGKHLWGKLKDEERFQVLEDLISIMVTHGIPFFAGLLAKRTFLRTLPKGKSLDNMIEFKTLLPAYFHFVESNISTDDFMVIIDDGDEREKRVVRETLQSPSIQQCVPDLIIQRSKYSPILQLADAGLWVLQSYHRLDSTDVSKKATKVRALYATLQQILQLHCM